MVCMLERLKRRRNVTENSRAVKVGLVDLPMIYQWQPLGIIKSNQVGRYAY